MFFYKHNVYKHTGAQIFEAYFLASFLYINCENLLIAIMVVLI